jgi:signal transduction histidine kinase
MSFKDLPIQRKLMTVILLTSGAVLLLTCALFVTYEVISLRKGMVEGLVTSAQITAANSTGALAFYDQEDAKEVLSALKNDPRLTIACIYDSAGELFATYPPEADPHLFPASPEPPGYRFESAHLIVFCPAILAGRTNGMVYLKSDLTALTDRYRAYAWLAIGVLLTSFLVAYLISKTLQKQISAPILTLAQTARAISDQHDFSVRAARINGNELGLLTDAFNQMLAQIQDLNSKLELRVQERTSELEAANKELEAFSYSVSHDLRAPLRHIDGFAGMLRQESSTGLDAAGRRYLGIISESAKRMGALIDDLLVFSRMGRAEMRRTKVKMNDLVTEVLQEMASDLQGRNIRWDIGPLPEVNADRPMLKQVWVNLLSNAVKYTRHRDQAEITVRCGKTESGDLEFSVEDNGAGFDMSYADKLFGVFQRLHQAEEFEGTGIGLANVRRIVLRHGGRTRAVGEVNKGATFYFTLPTNTK